MATVNLKQELTDQILYETFQHFNISRDGYITAEDLTESMRRCGHEMELSESLDMISEVAKGKDRIDFEKFKSIMLEDAIVPINGSSPYPQAWDVITSPEMPRKSTTD